MADEVKDVAEVVPAEEVVNEEQVTTPAQEDQAEETPSTQEVKPEVIKDSRPVENVAWEVKRKLDETIPTLQNEIRELKNFITESRKPQEQVYEKSQLLAYAADPNTSVSERIAAYKQVEIIDRAERIKDYESIATTARKNTEAETRRGQSANWVAQNFPETVVKDHMGNSVGWNNQSPVLAKINEYMNRDEALRNHPEGFMMAAKAAAFDLGITPTSNKKLDRTVGQLRKEQKKQLASSGGTRSSETPESVKQSKLEKMKQEYGKTGDRKLFEEILKQTGRNPFAT